MSARERLRKVVCISTSKPNDSIATPASGGSLTIVCPFTGSVVSSMKVSADITGKLPIGVSSVSLFPKSFSPKDSLALAFGSSAKKDDTYAILATLRQTALAPTLHWKCRLPEAQLSAGLLVSTCGNYVVGGGVSGNVYVWKTLGGVLLATFKAHYRSVSCMAWSSCGRILVTGGADGIIHAFSLQLIVATDSTESSIQPFRSFSHHQLSITTLKALPSGRVVSGAQDGQVTVIELFSEQVLASIQLPHPVTSMDATAHRLFVGTQQGSIYCIDLDQYALHQTHQQGAVIVQRHKVARSAQHGDAVFGLNEGSPVDSSASYQVKLHGHDRPVTAVAVIFDYDEEWLVSGDETGMVKVWDMASRACIRTIHLWSQNKQSPASSSTKPSSAAQHPVASITVLEQYSDQDKPSESLLHQVHQQSHTGGRNQSSKNQQSVGSQIKPLQRFSDESSLAEAVTVKLNRPEHMLWHNVTDDDMDVRAAIRKRVKRATESTNGSTAATDEKDAEIQRLRQELAVAKQTIKQQYNAVE